MHFQQNVKSGYLFRSEGKIIEKDKDSVLMKESAPSNIPFCRRSSQPSLHKFAIWQRFITK
jgi:hypothetical protein